MQESESCTRGGGISHRTFEIAQLKARVPVNVSISSLRQDETFDEGSSAGLSLTEAPQRETNVLLAVGSQQMLAGKAVNRSRHGHTAGGAAYCESHRRQT